MKATELIKRLQELVEEYGDLTVEKSVHGYYCDGDEEINSMELRPYDKYAAKRKGPYFLICE